MRIENRMVVDAEWVPRYMPVCRCGECERDIYPGEEYFDFDGDIVCEDCERDYVRKNYRRCAE